MRRLALLVGLVATLLWIGPRESRAELTGGESFVPGRVIVKLTAPLPDRAAQDGFALTTPFGALNRLIVEEGISSIERALAVSTHASRSRRDPTPHGLDRIYELVVPVDTDIFELIARLSDLPEVDYAEPDYLVRARTTPDDPLFPQQWYFDQPSPADMDGPEAWEIAVGGETIIAIVDSGVFAGHEDLAAKVVQGYDLVNDDPIAEDEHYHGTAVSSVAGASTDNGLGMAGTCWGCRLMPVKVIDGDGMAGQSRVADGIVWAVDAGARIINLSLGYYNPPAQTLSTAVAYAADAGAVMITAGGNDNLPVLGYPSELAETMTAGATNDADWRSFPMCGNPQGGSNYNARLDFVAPGEHITVATLSGGYYTLCGTSFSSPLVAGLLGIMQSLNPSLGREEARHLLRSAADDEVGNPSEDVPGFDPYHGWGRIDMHRTLRASESSMSLHLADGVATRLLLEIPNPVADSYDFIRGHLDALSESAMGVSLGEVVCLENDSPDPDTAGGHEDTETPAPGEGFFYLSRFNGAPGAGSYGGSTRNRERVELPWSWVTAGGQQGARLGISVASAGDTNGDGYDEVIAGAYFFDNGEQNEGAAFVYQGSADGLGDAPVWMVEGEAAEAILGNDVDGAGDVNGDGYDDVIIGASQYANGELDEGRAYVYLGSPAGLQDTPHWSAEGDQAGARFGFKVGAAGDVNDDGYDDVVVAARFYDQVAADTGLALVYEGSASGLPDTPSWTFTPGQASAQVTSVAGAGDVNGDGYDDVVVGSRFYDNGETDEGRIFVFFGSATGLAGSPSAVREIDAADAQFGFAVASAGDVDANGYDDLIVGAPLYTNGETTEGAVFVYSSSALGLSASPVWSFECDEAGAGCGHAVNGAGDVNDDGYDDIIVGGDLFDTRRTDAGQVWLFAGSSSGLSAAPVWLEPGRQQAGNFGWSADGAGDVNGDGIDDLIVGAYRHDVDLSNEGQVFVYHGRTGEFPGTDCAPGSP